MYCHRCNGAIVWQHSTATINGKDYHLVCALKEAYRKIPLNKEVSNADSVPQDTGFVDTLPPSGT